MKIDWSEFAVCNLENLKAYIAKDSPRYAEIFKGLEIFQIAAAKSRKETTIT